MDALETFTDERWGLTATVRYDDTAYADSPRDWDNCWVLLGFPNSRRNFGDEEIDLEGQHWLTCPACDGSGGDACGRCGGHGEVEAETVEQYVKALHPEAALVVPIQCYDHSLVRYYAGKPQTESWDTGLAGVAVIDRKTIDEEWDGDEDAALKYLDGELETYTDWANGTVYYYTVENEDGDVLDSCGGIYGEEYAEEEAKAALQSARMDAESENRERVYWLNREVETVG
jgi:hypothetical protein